MKKLFSLLSISVIVAVVAASCTKEQDQPSTPVTGVTLSPETMEMEIGEQKVLTATVTPKEATKKSVTFSSSKESVAIVSKDGVVEAMAAGSSIITVTTDEGSYKAHCTVTVVQKSVHVTGISLNKSALSMKEGDEFTLIASVTPENAKDKSVNWKSENKAVATVSAEGVVKAIKAGKTTVTVTTTDGGKKATCTIDVAEGMGAVTGEASHISCRNAEISGKANLPGTTTTDLSFGVLYSTSSGVLIGSATQIKAKLFDLDYNFTINTEVLEPETTYYYRSYIIQDKEIAYGELKSFKTLAVSSMIKTADATEINPKDAVLNAELDLTDCKYDGIEYGFEVTPNGGQTHTLKSTNHSEKKFSVKDATLSGDTRYSFVAYVKLDGKIYKGESKTFTTKSLPKGVDLGLSVKWHQCNIGASRPEEYGCYFAWGDVVGQTWNGSSWSGGGFSSYPKYELDLNNNLKPEYDAAHVNLGGSWRMPTKAEQQELIDNCTCTWTSNYNSTGVAGRIFTSKKEGYTDKSIFLPAAGRGYGSYLHFAGSNGIYWSSTFDFDYYAWYIYFTSANVYTSSDGPYRGFPVRPVSE